MSTYSFMDFSASIVGVGGNINMGYGAGTADEGFSMAPNGDKNAMTIGSDGEGMHSLRADKSGTISVRLLKTSPTNTQLQNMYNLQSLSSKSWGNNVIVARNSASGDVSTARKVAFKRIPDWNNAKDGDIVTWIFDAVKIDKILGEF